MHCVVYLVPSKLCTKCGLSDLASDVRIVRANKLAQLLLRVALCANLKNAERKTPKSNECKCKKSEGVIVSEMIMSVLV